MLACRFLTQWGVALRVPVLDGDGHAGAIEKLAPGNAARHLRGVFFLQASIVRDMQIVKQLTRDSSLAGH